MEVIHCFNFIMIFFILIISVGNLLFSLRMSYFLVKMFDYMKSIGREDEENYEDDEEEENSLPQSGLVDLPVVQDYAEEKNQDEE